ARALGRAEHAQEAAGRQRRRRRHHRRGRRLRRRRFQRRRLGLPLPRPLPGGPWRAPTPPPRHPPPGGGARPPPQRPPGRRARPPVKPGSIGLGALAGSGHDVPTTLVVLIGLLAAGALGAGGWWLWSRVLARRFG